jgi:uncharacterized membrane protein required for colicin V production
MPFEMLDFILGGIMLLSALLALTRGFTREVLSLVSWGLAAAAGLFAAFNAELVAFALDYVQSDIIARIAVGGAVFLVVLIILSIISVRVADWVLDSAAGPFDRTFGMIYGLARGLLLVAIAYLFYVWLVPPEKREDWVRNARSLAVIEATGRIHHRLSPRRHPRHPARPHRRERHEPAGPAARRRRNGRRRLCRTRQHGAGTPDREHPVGRKPAQDQGQEQQQDQPLFGREQQN